MAKIAALVLSQVLCSAAVRGANVAPVSDARLPTIRWGQDSDTIYLRLQVKCASEREVLIKPLRFTHRCKSETGVLYETDIPLRAPIVPSASYCKPVGVNEQCALSKFVPHAQDRLSSVEPDENVEFHAALRRDFDRWLESVPPRGTDIIDLSAPRGQAASTKINPRDEDEDSDEKADALEQRTGGDGRELVRTVPESAYRRDANMSAPELPAGHVTLQSAAKLFDGDDGAELVILDVQYAWCRRCDQQARTVADAARINNGTKPYAFGWVDATHEPLWAHALGLQCGGGTHTAASTGVDKSAPPSWSQGGEGEGLGAGRPMCGLYVFTKASTSDRADAMSAKADDAGAILARAGLRLVSTLAVLQSNRMNLNDYVGDGPYLILRQLEALSGPPVLTVRTPSELEELHNRAASLELTVALAWLPTGSADDTTNRARSAFQRVAEQVFAAGRTIFAQVPLSFATDDALPAELAPPPTIERASRRMKALLNHGILMRLERRRELTTNESQAQANATYGELEAALASAGVHDDNSIVDANGVAHPYVSVHAQERYFSMEGHAYKAQHGGANISKNVSTWAAGARFERLAGTSCGTGGQALGADEAAYALLRFVVVDGTPLLSPLNVMGKDVVRHDQGRHGAWIDKQDGRVDPGDTFLPPWPYYAEALDRLIDWRPKATSAALTCSGMSQVRELGGSHSAGVRGFLHVYDRADAWGEYMQTSSTLNQMENFRVTAAGMKGRMPVYVIRKSCSAEIEKMRRLKMSDITFPSASAVTTFAEPRDQSEGAEEPMAWVVPKQVIQDEYKSDGNRALLNFYEAIATENVTVAKPKIDQICVPGQVELPPGQGMMDVKNWVPGEIRPMGGHSIHDDFDWISGAMGIERVWRAGAACPDVDAATAADRADATNVADGGAVVLVMYNSTNPNDMRDLRTHYIQKLLVGIAKALRDLVPFPHNVSALANGMRPTPNTTDEELKLAEGYSATAKAGVIVAEFDVQYNHYTPGLFFKPEDEGGKRVENKPWPSGYVKPLSDKVKRERVDLIDMVADDMLKQKRLMTSKALKAAGRQKFNKFNSPQIFVGDPRLLRRLQRRRKLKACGADLLALEALYKTSKGTQGLKPVKRFSNYVGPIKQSNVLKWLKKKSPFIAKRWAELKQTLKDIRVETALEKKLAEPLNKTFFSKDRPFDNDVDITPEKGWGTSNAKGLPTPGGVLKRLVRKGKPSSIYGRVAVGDTVKAHYHGYRTNGTIFDSSIAFRRPYEFTLGSGNVISCWDVAFLTMEIGERAIITCRPDYAYGDKGVGNGKILPCETLQFDVQLLNITQRNPEGGPRNYTLGDPGYNETNATCVEENRALFERGEDPNVDKWPGYVVKPGFGLVLKKDEDEPEEEDGDEDKGENSGTDHGKDKSKTQGGDNSSGEKDKKGQGEEEEKEAVAQSQRSTSDNDLSAAIQSGVAAQNKERMAELEKAVRKAKTLLNAKLALGKSEAQIASARARVKAAVEELENVVRDGTESEQKRKALVDAVEKEESGDS